MKTILAVTALLAAGAVNLAATHQAAAACSTRMECRKPAPAAPKRPVNVKAVVAHAKAAIVERLRDPESVRWRRAKVDPHGNACVEVNAKNGFGGYTGFTVWAVDANGWVMEGAWCTLRNATLVSAQ